MSYIDDHRASGFQVGDRVRVFATCSNRAGGWQNEWANGMKVGTEGEISYDNGAYGFEVNFEYQYPWFVLEKVASDEAAENNI